MIEALEGILMLLSVIVILGLGFALLIWIIQKALD